jgi:hypothetical protein
MLLPFLLCLSLPVQVKAIQGAQGGRKTLEALKVESQKKGEALDRLIRLRVRRSLLLPIPEEELLLYSRPLEGLSREEFQAMMDKEASHTTRLQKRLLALRRGVFMQESSPHASPSGIASKESPESGGRKSTSGIGSHRKPIFSGKKKGSQSQLRDPVTGVVDHSLDLVRVPDDHQAKKGPVLPLPFVMDPLLGGKPAIAVIQPTKKLEKRLRALLDAGFPRSALVLVDKALRKERRSLRLHYLRARILESLGRLEEAKKVLQIVEKVDSETDEGGKELLGPWARAAKSALDYLSWRSGVKSKTFKVPDLKDLKW